MISNRFSIGWAILMAAVAIGATQQSVFAQAVTTTPVFTLERNAVEGASSTLVRTPEGIDYTVITSELETTSAHTIWVIIFNNPELCSPPGCGRDDNPNRGGDPAIQVSNLYGTGSVATADGMANFGGRLKVGDTSGALVGPGLVNPFGAEIHMIVRSHGPIIPDMLSEQLTTLNAGCPPNMCEDKQVAVHTPFTDPVSVRLNTIESLVRRIAAANGLGALP